MQAIVETLFDAVYLLSVITIGILIPRAFALCNTGLENYTVSLGMGKWITSVTMTIFYVLLYYVWRQRYKINGKGVLTAAVYGLAGVRIGLCMDAPKPVAPFQISHLLGRLPQYSVRPAGISGHCAVLSQCKKFRGSGLNLTAVMLVVRGVAQIQLPALSSGMNAAISGMAGIGHITLGVSLTLLLVQIRRSVLEA